MRVEPMIALLPLDGFVPLLRALEDAGPQRSGYVRESVRQVLVHVHEALRGASNDIVRGADQIADASTRAQALEGAAHLRAAADTAGRGAAAVRDAPRARPWRPLHVATETALPSLSAARSELEQGLRLLANVPEVGVPSLRRPTVDEARRAAELIDTRRARVLDRIAGRLSPADRATVDAVPGDGPIRRALTGRTAQRVLNVDVVGAEHVPTAGNAILAPVHAGNFDVLHAHMGHGRPHRIMAVDWLWKIPGVGRLLDRGGAFPVSHANSGQSMRIAESMLAEGQSLLLYPSGNIPMVAPIQPAKRGAALLAIRTGTPVVPAGEFGTAPPVAYGTSWLRRVLAGERPQAAIAFGEPIPTHHLDPTSSRDIIALTAEIERRQRELGEVARRHVEAASVRRAS